MRPVASPALLALLMLAGCSDSPDPTASNTPAPVSVAPEAAATRPVAQSDSVVVVFFGDSLTAGYGLANPGRDAYPVLVGDTLRAQGLPVRVVNAGNSGETSAGGLRRVDWVLSRTTPDVFVLALGANDGLRGQDADAMASNLRAILGKVREAAPQARLVVAGMEALPNYGADYAERFRAVFPTVASEYDAELIPFLLDGVAGVAALNQGDQVHPTPAGQKILARTVAGVVTPVVREVAAEKASA